MTSQKALIVKNPKILGGTPTIKGTRIPVTLLNRLIKTGYPNKVILSEYPSLTIEMVIAFRNLMGASRVSKAE